MATCEEMKIPFRGGHIAGRWYGNRGERPILAVHGWLDNAGSFALLAPRLCQHVAILAIDLPGHGLSSHYAPGITYTVLGYVSVIREIVLYFKWPRVSLMGHSMGASLIHQFAALFPQLVDMMISIDTIHPFYLAPYMQVTVLNYSLDKIIIETDRKLQALQTVEAQPSYTFSQLENILHDASEYSIDVDKTKYILERSTTATRAESDKYYFSRDSCTKYYNELSVEPGLCLAMAERLYKVKWLVLKAQDSHIIMEELATTQNIRELLKQNNPNFSYQVIDGVRHHCHLNNAELVAEYILPFLQQHRPAEPFVMDAVTCKL